MLDTPRLLDRFAIHQTEEANSEREPSYTDLTSLDRDMCLPIAQRCRIADLQHWIDLSA